MRKIVTILGARPQFVKAAAVSREIAKYDQINEIIIHTGQHFDEKMSDIFFHEMSIPEPKYYLDINSLSHGAMTGRMLEKIEGILKQEKPDAVVVYGDTNSTIAGALAAKKMHIKVAHVEAGLRSFNMIMPEEINRILCDRISDFLFCPTDTAVDNLKREGFEGFGCKFMKTGDVMLDSALYYAKFSEEYSTVLENQNSDDFVLVTIHRQENTDDPDRLNGIIEALNRISEEINVIVPLHPRTRKILEKNQLKTKFNIIEPVGFFDMIELLKNCELVLTDSGGLQKEAFFFRKMCVTMRDETEWVELVNNGFNYVAGADPNRIYEEYRSSLEKDVDFDIDLYGNGNAGSVIVKELWNSL